MKLTLQDFGGFQPGDRLGAEIDGRTIWARFDTIREGSALAPLLAMQPCETREGLAFAGLYRPLMPADDASAAG
jgi:hypothetical protein